MISSFGREGPEIARDMGRALIEFGVGHLRRFSPLVLPDRIAFVEFDVYRCTGMSTREHQQRIE